MVISENIVKNLEGLQTIDSVMSKLGIKRDTAIQYIYSLRKKGLIETRIGKGKKRLYRITKLPKISIGNPGYYDIINKYSPIKVWEKYEHRVIGRRISIEETIAWAASTNEDRLHLAMLALYKKVRNWPELYKWALYFKSRRKVGALYDVAKKFIKIKKMDGRIRKRLLEAGNENKYLYPNLKSRDFKDIENKWRVFIDLNKADLMRYKE
ncbi:hypothetical protein HYV88_04560 [Candidatus Woesearchaeota archaeon]|nr:hypothetical protein [Candidatus Woesearchaeota archaeon]